MTIHSNIITTIMLNPGLRVTLSDETRHYFGGYYHVKVLVHCIVPLDKFYFDDEAQYLDALEKLGESVSFERILEKMAVPEQDITSVRDQLVAAFNETTLRYLTTPDFDRRLVRNEYRICVGKFANRLAAKALYR